MVFKEYPIIARALNERTSERYGVSCCVSMVEHYLYVGNSEGLIRVFDLKTQTEMDPLQSQSRVTCIDIDEASCLLLSGHKDGSVTLWDLSNNKLLKSVPDLHETSLT